MGSAEEPVVSVASLVAGTRAGSSATVSGAATSLVSASFPAFFVDLLALRIKPVNSPVLGTGEAVPDFWTGSVSSESDLTSSTFLSFLKEAKKLDFRFCSLGLVAGLAESATVESSTTGVVSVASTGTSMVGPVASRDLTSVSYNKY